MSEKDLPDDIEQIIDRKVEEKLREREKAEQSSSVKASEKDTGSVSRRNFLKTLGLGAGALTFSSLVSGWSTFQPRTRGLSDIDADTVDGVNIYVQSSKPSDPDVNDIWFNI
ncbi:twin-arginine translocation signal domain-containing protein [Candidatus Nanohalococcus occultus]|uniref:Twin-arginine translocation signal domain-containing protein n=1 Tax=Candidatus Nanohalococcus occultus TaxID=2978047 RepID=A0ABY8CF04_9ARCH|nr:hypothetical protein SVXNc_0796 [Candidatus Nanohaloarchaeota archaeon SVXNc]